MLKKIYIPTDKEIKGIQDYGADLYRYLFTKQIEILIVNGIQMSSILGRCYQYQSENPDIVHSICSLYPEEIKHSQIAQNDKELCLKMINQGQRTPLYELDNLCLFNNVVLNDVLIIEAAIKKLAEELAKNPRYRFEYREPNYLLDKIFTVHMSEKQEHLLTPIALKEIIKIEPAFLLKISDYRMDELLAFAPDIKTLLDDAIDSYAGRYQVSSNIGYKYIEQDILSNPNQDVKRLLKTIKRNR